MNQDSPLKFQDLKLGEELLQALHEEGYEHPTPIQAQAIPHILARKDILGCAQTGTGKTAAFALPILQLLADTKVEKVASGKVRALILTPTRELASQIGESFDRYGAKLPLTNTVIFGGVGQSPQAAALRRGVDILVATPGRLLDLIDQRLCDLSRIEIFVLDEADRMLDMGFVHDVKRVLRLIPKKRHSLFFSATMPPDIIKLAREILTNPAEVKVTPIASTAEKIGQSVYFVEKANKRYLLEELMKDSSIQRALVFCRTKHGADRVARILNQARVTAEAIHGNKSQNNRVRALNNFKDGVTRILVATDIAARGIDIDGVTHVINYELPNIPESYVHRIGRTARAGREGTAISLCDQEERAYLADIERLIKKKVPVATLDFKVPTETQRAPQHAATRAPAHSPERSPRASAHSAERAPRADRNPRHAPRRDDSRREDRRPSGQHPRTSAHPPRAREQQARSGGHAPRSGERQTRVGGHDSRSNPQHPRSRSQQARPQHSSARPQGHRQDETRDSSSTPRNTRSEKRPDTRPKRDNRPWWKKLVSRKE